MSNNLRNKVKDYLLAVDSPRLQMAVIVGMTGLVAFIISKLLLRYEVSSMVIRYPISLSGAYIFFLLSIFLWTKYYSRTIELLAMTTIEKDIPNKQPKSEKSSLGTIFDIIQYGDDLIPLIIIIVTALWLAVVTILLVYNAPFLLADLLVDSVIVVGLYKRSYDLQARAWFASVLKCTWSYFLFIIIMSGLSGLFIQIYFPDTITIGDVLRRIV